MKNIIPILFLLFASITFAADDIKDSDLAGSWYPASKAELQNLIQGYLDAANPPKIDGQIFAMISPHAGYRFSGVIAAYGFKALQGKGIKTAIIVGFSHRVLFDGISVYDRGSWRTPLGDIKIDETLAKDIISKNPRIKFGPKLFDNENSVEMQLPFVQGVFKDAKIVPIAFGNASFEDAEILADALTESLKGRSDYIVIASTDMSHYLPYQAAVSTDSYTISLLNKMDARALYNESMSREATPLLCGVMPVTATLLAAKKMGFNKIGILKYANSGDTSGDKAKVVGYVSALIYKEGESNMLNDNQRKRLLQIARESITGYLKDGKRKSFTESDPVLNEPMGAFVTLHERGQLRGCIGNMIGRGPLCRTVADMAVEAATGDPRFPKGTAADEMDKIDIEISVLSPLKRVKSYEEVKIPGHGVLVRRGFSSGVYLPQVATETGWNREEFLTSLCGQKAGMPPDAWKDPSTEIYVFSAEVFGEKEK